jgi:hypothetical protein
MIHPALARVRAVVAGLVTVVILSTVVDIALHASGVFPPMGQPMPAGLWCLAIGYRAAFTVLGGWIAGRLDPARSMKAPIILTGLGAVLGLMGVGVAYSKPEMGPAWYAWGVAISGPPCSYLGGLFAVRSLSRS